ncbi:MAG: hypothetical protein NTX87_11480 [Planctomycetota bacterium]|nr:hypothetical protein [Planctomycetota bacterium]
MSMTVSGNCDSGPGATARSFTDACGRTWIVAITVGGLRRVQESANLNLLGGPMCGLIASLMADPVLAAAVLFAICRPQADALGVTAEDFADALDGRACNAGLHALLKSWGDFWSGPSHAEAAIALATLHREFLAWAHGAAEAGNECSPEVNRALRLFIDQHLGNPGVLGIDVTVEADALRERLSRLAGSIQICRPEDTARLLTDAEAVELLILKSRQAERRRRWSEYSAKVRT